MKQRHFPESPLSEEQEPTLPDGYVLIHGDDAVNRRRSDKGRRFGRVRAKKDGGSPWVGPWRIYDFDAVKDALAHSKNSKRR